MMLNSIKEGLAFLKTTLLVQDLLNKEHETDSSDSMGDDRKRPAFVISKEKPLIIEKDDTQRFADDDVPLDSSIPVENPSSLANHRRLANFHMSLSRQAICCSVAVSPYLRFVPQMKHGF